MSEKGFLKDLTWKQTAYYIFVMLMIMCAVALSEAIFIWMINNTPQEQDGFKCVDVILEDENCKKINCYKNGILFSEETKCVVVFEEPPQPEQDTNLTRILG